MSIITMLSIIIDLYLMRNLCGLGYLFTCLINLLSQCEHHNRSLFNEKSLWSWLPLYLSYQSIITMLSIIIDLYLMRNLRGLGYLFTCLIMVLFHWSFVTHGWSSYNTLYSSLVHLRGNSNHHLITGDSSFLLNK
jgi:hypothetical protein